MCSVVGCDSERRSAQRFKLPEDPERRLEWVQFLATVNTQRFKESSWTDITICSEHFKDGCFESPTPSHSGSTGRVLLTLKPGAVPSLCLRSDEPEPDVERPGCEEPVDAAEVACQRGHLKTADGATTYSESGLTLMAAQGNPVSRGVSCSTDTSDTFISLYGQIQPNNVIREKAALLKMKGKYVVNEKRPLQLFSRTCPSCGCKLEMEKVTYGVLVILNQQCLQCEYRNQWKSQINAGVPTAEDEHLTGHTDLTPVTQQALTTDDTDSSVTGVPEIVAVIEEDSDPMEESSDQGDMDSDEDWKPAKSFLLASVPQKKRKVETEEEEEEKHDDYTPKYSQLCTDCGVFFNKRKPHTCEHKSKPYSCNICGKRCVSEVALNSHSRIHDENYEHRCKYCNATFKTKADKNTHEPSHLTQGKPYKCPDCSETFATNKERKIHLEDHRGPQQLKCHICGIEFLWPLSLQRHLAVHTGEKPFKCSVCQRGFSQPSHLKSHMRLHTGERPYKCQQCDKCFNHNVSLKSHVQRYHTSNPEQERKKETESNNGEAQGDGNKRGADSGFDNVEEEQDTEEEKIHRLKKKKKSTGRPIGRPKSYESGNLATAVQVQGQSSNTKAGKQQVQERKRTQCSDEESEGELSDSNTSFYLTEEEEEIKNTARSRGRTKNSDSDSDFDPVERKKKRYSSQSSGSLGKGRGRPRKHPVV